MHGSSVTYTVQPVSRIELPRRLLERQKLRMPRRIAGDLAQVACAGDDARLGGGAARGGIDRSVHDDRADGNLVHLGGTPRLVERHAHVVFIRHDPYYMVS